MKKVSRELPKMEAGLVKPEMIVGLDLGDRYSHYCLLNSDGDVVEEGRVQSTEAALRRRGRLGRVLWSGVCEAFRVAFVGRIEHLLPLLYHDASQTVVQHFRGQQRDPAVMMFSVVPSKKLLAKSARVLDGAEALRKLRPVFQSFELALRVRIVVRDVW